MSSSLDFGVISDPLVGCL